MHVTLDGHKYPRRVAPNLKPGEAPALRGDGVDGRGAAFAFLLQGQVEQVQGHGVFPFATGLRVACAGVGRLGAVGSVRAHAPGLLVFLQQGLLDVGLPDGRARTGGDDLAATITTHHLIINRNHILAGGIKPHYYCLPVAKREKHRLALRRAATSGSPRYFLGTDSAPHVDALKEHACGCAGCFTATNTLSLLAHVFEEEGALDRLAGFTSLHGPAFYRLPVNAGTIRLEKRAEPCHWPEKIVSEAGPVTVFNPGFPVYWHVGS